MKITKLTQIGAATIAATIAWVMTGRNPVSAQPCSLETGPR
jgi:hypothetical protein